MKPIIEPFLFYLMGVSESLWGVSVGVLAVSVIGLIIFISVYLASIDSASYSSEQLRQQGKTYLQIGRKGTIICVVTMIVSILLVVLIPRKSTVIEMMLASAATADNIGAGVDAIKSAADYIIETIQKLQ